MLRTSLFLTMALLVIAIPAIAQSKKKQHDSLSVYGEFTKVAGWYRQSPLQLELRLSTKILPTSETNDSMITDIKLCYNQSEFYMQADRMEQIINDSMMVLINGDARMIKLYPNNQSVKAHLQKASAFLTQDSSIQDLATRYAATAFDEQQNSRRIILQTREKVTGTNFPRELISLAYQKNAQVPEQLIQSKFSLVPIDSATYLSLLQVAELSAHLVTNNLNGRDFYFIVKEQQISCRFISIRHEENGMPVRTIDRIVKQGDGTWAPAGGYKEYSLSKEF